MKDRIKALRQTLGLSMEKFAEPLGVTKGSISKIEHGENYPSTMLQKLICSTFNVNEDWLKTGNGEMFVTLGRKEKVVKYVASLTKEPMDSKKLKLLETLAELDSDEELEAFSKFVIAYAKKLNE